MKYMTAKHRWVPGALSLFKRAAQHRESYIVRVRGKDIPVLPDVFSPKYFPDAVWFAKELPAIVGRRSFLEIGTGTGLIALFVALNGAQRVVTTDINPAAIENARQTFAEHGVKIAVRCGDVYKTIDADEKVDVIFWNHPFHYSLEKPPNLLLRAGFDYKYRDLQTFFAGAAKHLNPGGEILLGTGNMARINEIKRIAYANGYRWTLLKKEAIPAQEGSSAERDNRIYSFKSRAV